MAAAIGLRGDFGAQALRALTKRAKERPQPRRLLTLAAIYDGATRSEAARISGVTLQIVRDWVLRFNALGPDGLLDRTAPGQPSCLNDEHRVAPGAHAVLILDQAGWRTADKLDVRENIAVSLPPSKGGFCRSD